MIEGDLFSSLFEGGTSETYHLVKQEKDKATIEVDWTNDAKGVGGPPTYWKDRIFLVRTKKGWLISDFTHDGDWDFMTKGSVPQILGRVAKECDTLRRHGNQTTLAQSTLILQKGDIFIFTTKYISVPFLPY